jgi:carbonic anhydrase/acetyltransferase-like protein (isoleucine patch superfamily)
MSNIEGSGYIAGHKRLRTLVKDFRGSLFWTLDETASNILAYWYSAWCSLLAAAWGVKLSRGIRFYGLARFKRYPQSSILIGEKCTFRSSQRANFFGLNHGCLLSTHSRIAEIVIGKGSGFSGTSLSAYESVKIGSGVLCGANTVITDFDWHPIRAAGQMASRPVVIEDRVWLGANCLVLKGVRIGENTIVGANSVVLHSLPANVLAAGNPARVIRPL